MNLSKKDLERAAFEKIITEEQAQSLWKFFTSSSVAPAQVNGGTILHYLGAFVVLLSMGWLASIWQDQFSGSFSLFWIGLVYGIIFLLAGLRLWHRSSYRNGGGILLTLAVCMVPLMVYGLQIGWGTWPQPLGENPSHEEFMHYHRLIGFHHVTLDLATAIAAACLLWFVRFPFLTAPLWWALWALSMDILQIFFPDTFFIDYNYKPFSLVAVGVGVVFLIIAFILDLKAQKDFAFWGYLFGLLSAWTGLIALLPGTSEWAKAGFCLVNIALLVIAELLDRKVFLFFGILGILGYLWYLAYNVFADSWLFPFVVSLLGLGVLYLGMLYQRHQPKIRQAVRRFIGK